MRNLQRAAQAPEFILRTGCIALLTKTGAWRCRTDSLTSRPLGDELLRLESSPEQRDLGGHGRAQLEAKRSAQSPLHGHGQVNCNYRGRSDARRRGRLQITAPVLALLGSQGHRRPSLGRVVYVAVEGFWSGHRGGSTVRPSPSRRTASTYAGQIPVICRLPLRGKRLSRPEARTGGLWLNYLADHPFTGILSLHLEGFYRRTLSSALAR